jgi:tRNA threonylcarbamoyladenosine biosynthesis protein TsaB
VILVVDTSLVGAQLALVKDGKVQWRGAHLDNSGSLQAIARLFAAAGVRPAGLAGIAVSVGPGTFTGIKIGLAFAYGLVAARGGATPLPIYGDSALGAAAEELRRAAGLPRLGVLLPATRTHGFLALAGEGPRELLVNTAPSGEPFAPEATIAARLAEGPAALPLQIAGAWPAMAERLAAAGRQHSEISMETLCSQGLSGLCARAVAAFPAGYSAKLPSPRYLRLSTAEEALVAARQAPIV